MESFQTSVSGIVSGINVTGVVLFTFSVALTRLILLNEQLQRPTAPHVSTTGVSKSTKQRSVKSNLAIKDAICSDTTCVVPVKSGCEVVSFHVIIIGGGIGGLATALALQQKGIKCTVYERDQLFEDRKQGYGLTLSNLPSGALAKLGILDECVAQDCTSRSHWVFTPQGKVIGYYGRAFKSEKASMSITTDQKDASRVNAHRGNLRVPRQDLRRMLLDRLAPDTVHWDHKFSHIYETEESLEVIFENGLRVRGDLVVGTDGLRSRVRQFRDQSVADMIAIGEGRKTLSPLLSSDATGGAPAHLQYIGVTVILGISSFQHPLLARQGFYVLDGVHRLFTMPFREDASGTVLTMWQLSFSGLSEGEANLLKMSGSKAQLEDAMRRTADWFPVVRKLIRGTTEADTWSTPLYDRDPMLARRQVSRTRGESTRGRVTVLGDACHPMSMFKDVFNIQSLRLGQGANQALEDAPRLAEWLLKQGKQFTSLTLQMRIYHFEKEMLDRTTKWVKASRAASQHLHSPAVLEDGDLYGIDGMDSDVSTSFLRRLDLQSINAATFENSLENRVLQEYKKFVES